jgi:hypothetical protein
MRIYSGFILSECACISAGLGAFPVLSQPSPGQVEGYWFGLVWFGVSSVGCGQDADLFRLHPVGVRLHQCWPRRLPRAESTLTRPGRRPVARYRDSLTRHWILGGIIYRYYLLRGQRSSSFWFLPALGIPDILVRVRIRIRGSGPLTNESGSDPFSSDLSLEKIIFC